MENSKFLIKNFDYSTVVLLTIQDAVSTDIQVSMNANMIYDSWTFYYTNLT